MFRIYITYYFLLTGLGLKAQPVINGWYDFGRTQSVLSSIYATDTCYYGIGMAASNTVPGIWDLVFTKIDFNGNISLQNFMHNDTISINCFNSNLVPTYDDNFVTFVDYDEYFLFIKYDPNGDTLFTSIKIRGMSSSISRV